MSYSILSLSSIMYYWKALLKYLLILREEFPLQPANFLVPLYWEIKGGNVANTMITVRNVDDLIVYLVSSSEYYQPIERSYPPCNKHKNELIICYYYYVHPFKKRNGCERERQMWQYLEIKFQL